MDGFLASRSFRRSGKQLDRKSSLLLTPSLTSTRRAKLSICHNSSPDSTFPSSHSIFAAAAPPPAGSPRHRASTGQGWGGWRRGLPRLFRGRAACRAAQCPGGARCMWGSPHPPGESPQPTARTQSPPGESCSLSLASFSPIFYVSSCRYKGGFVMAPVCEDRGPWLTFRKTDCKCLVAARADRTRHQGRVSVSVASTEVAMDPLRKACSQPASPETLRANAYSLAREEGGGEEA